MEFNTFQNRFWLVLLLTVFAISWFFTQTYVSLDSVTNISAEMKTYPEKPAEKATLTLPLNPEKGLDSWLINQKNQVDRAIEKSEQEKLKVKEFLKTKAWQVVEASSINESAVLLKPDLVNSQDHILVAQLRSNSLHENLIDNAISIAQETENISLRREIFSALIRLNTEQSQQALMTLYETSDSWLDKDILVASIRPQALDSQAALWLVDKFNKGLIKDELQRSVALNLVMTTIREGLTSGQVDDTLFARIDSAWHPLLYELYDGLKQTPVAKDSL